MQVSHWQTLTRHRRHSARLIVFCLVVVILFYLFERPLRIIEVELVVSSTSATNTFWIGEYFPQWRANIYINDDPQATLTIPTNKGRESATYLTYIIDNYSNLPQIAIFLHGRRYQWHNEDPSYDGVPVLQNLQLDYVLKHGFATLRCSWEPGCPSELFPDATLESREGREGFDDRAKTEAAFAPAFAELFPELQLPGVVAVHCGAQFAISRDQILKRPLEDYERYRRWLWSTPLPDYLSGRILEYSWHIIMGQPGVACPHAGECFCQKFGLCNLDCVEHSCAKRYKFNYGVLPGNWPFEGWGEHGWPERGWAD